MGAGAAAWLLYALTTLYGPKSTNTYHLSGLTLVLIQLSIILPMLVIWLTAIYGAFKFKQYARLINGSPDGKALNLLSSGLVLFIVAFIAQTLIGVLRRSIVGTDFMYPVVFLHNHLPLVLYLIGAIVIFVASMQLIQLVHIRLTWRRLLPILVPFLAVAILLGQFFYSNINHTNIGGIPNFSLPGKTPFYTMALPYLAVWFLGCMAITNILAYVRNVKGLLYRQALRYFAYGTMMVITFMIFVQILSFSATAMRGLSLGGLLGLIYILLIFYAGGFVLIGRGARNLTKIEASL
jgi:hypothetical protein